MLSEGTTVRGLFSTHAGSTAADAPSEAADFEAHSTAKRTAVQS